MSSTVCGAKDRTTPSQREWSWWGWGCVCYSAAVRYDVVIWSRKIRHEYWGGWTVQETKGPECKWERGVWTWGGCGSVWYSATVRYSTVIWPHKRRDESCGLRYEKNQRTWVQVRERSYRDIFTHFYYCHGETRRKGGGSYKMSVL